MNKALTYTVISILAFIIIQDERYLLGWDFLDMVFLTLMLIGIDRKWNAIYFTGLFSVALLNRETALFIPLWMFIGAVSKKEIKKIAYSVVLAMIGIVAIYLVRENMFAGAYRFNQTKMIYAGVDTEHATYGNFTYLLENITHPFSTYPPWKPSVDLIPAIIIATIGYLTIQWKRLNETGKKLVLMMLAMTTVIFTLTMIHETRGWIIVLPLLIYTFENGINYERQR